MVLANFDDCITGMSSNQECEIRWGNHPYKDGMKVCLFFGSHECKQFVSGDQYLALSSIEILNSRELNCKLAGVEVYISVTARPEDVSKVIRSGIVKEGYLPLLTKYYQNPEDQDQESLDNDDPETISSEETVCEAGYNNPVNRETEIKTVIAEPEVVVSTENIPELEPVPTETIENESPLSSDALPRKRKTRWYKPWTWKLW